MHCAMLMVSGRCPRNVANSIFDACDGETDFFFTTQRHDCVHAQHRFQTYVGHSHGRPMRVAPRNVARFIGSLFRFFTWYPWRRKRRIYFCCLIWYEVVSMPRAASHGRCTQVVGCQDAPRCLPSTCGSVSLADALGSLTEVGLAQSQHGSTSDVSPWWSCSRPTILHRNM